MFRVVLESTLWNVHVYRKKTQINVLWGCGGLVMAGLFVSHPSDRMRYMNKKSLGALGLEWCVKIVRQWLRARGYRTKNVSFIKASFKYTTRIFIHTCTYFSFLFENILGCIFERFLHEPIFNGRIEKKKTTNKGLSNWSLCAIPDTIIG